MINYYEELTPEEQMKVTQSIQLLYKQTFLLERKFDKKTNRFQSNRDFHLCNKHIEFIRAYFKVMGIEVQENSQLGVIYIYGEHVAGGKLPRLATLYLLILKLIYDEQMSTVSTSVNVYTTLSDMHERLGNYRLFKKQPSSTDIRRAISLLKRYQILEPVDVLEDIEGPSRMIIYPAINVVLFGGDARALLESISGGTINEGDDADDETEI